MRDIMSDQTCDAFEELIAACKEQYQFPRGVEEALRVGLYLKLAELLDVATRDA